jgi:hypothetical protein
VYQRRKKTRTMLSQVLPVLSLNHEIKESIDEIGKGSNPEMWTRKGNNKHNGKGNPPCSSINLKAFSRKDGDPSTSSIASKIGLPMTKDFTGCLSFTTGKKCQKCQYLKDLKNKNKVFKFRIS